MREALEKKTEEIKFRMEEMIPSHMHQSIISYLWDGYEPGSFLSAVISNNFKHACLAADSRNANSLADYGKFFTWYMPMGCWGSEENFKEWIQSGGWNGMLNTGPDAPTEIENS